MNRSTATLKKDQRGLVSIIITLIIMLVISLIVIGFARLSRREQRQALDRQLSTQAYYAAESGINDAIAEITNNATAFREEWKTDCNAFITDASLNPELSDNVEYTCLLVDNQPTTLEFTNVDNNSQVVPLKTSGTNIARVVISWQDKTGATDFTGCNLTKGTWPSATSWHCPVGVLRADLIDVANNLSITPESLNNELMNAFFLPHNSVDDGNLNYNSARGYTDGGVIHGVRCTSAAPTPAAPRSCTVEITGLNSNLFYLRLRSLYQSSEVTVIAYDSGGNELRLIDAQTKVDSTGKASDVLRRVQIRLPNDDGLYADFGLQSVTDLCKQLTVLPGSVTGSGAAPSCNPLN